MPGLRAMLADIENGRSAGQSVAAMPTTFALCVMAEGSACDEYLHSLEGTHPL